VRAYYKIREGRVRKRIFDGQGRGCGEPCRGAGLQTQERLAKLDLVMVEAPQSGLTDVLQRTVPK
jgi:hypothetical protein